MSEFFSVTLELLCHVYTSLANHITSHFGPRYAAEDDIQETFQERDDFRLHDEKETIIEEYENPRNFIDPSAWRRNIPAWKVSLINSTHFVFLVTFVVGGLIGLASLLLTWYIMSIVYACDWKSLADPTYPLHLKRRRIIDESYQSFILYFWQPALMCMVFKWQFLKDVNLLTCTLAGASLDLGYRFFLGLFDMYYPPWVPYPLNIVYIVVVIMASLSISKKIISNQKPNSGHCGVGFQTQFSVHHWGNCFVYSLVRPYFKLCPEGRPYKITLSRITVSNSLISKGDITAMCPSLRSS